MGPEQGTATKPWTKHILSNASWSQTSVFPVVCHSFLVTAASCFKENPMETNRNESNSARPATWLLLINGIWHFIFFHCGLILPLFKHMFSHVLEDVCDLQNEFWCFKKLHKLFYFLWSIPWPSLSSKRFQKQHGPTLKHGSIPWYKIGNILLFVLMEPYTPSQLFIFMIPACEVNHVQIGFISFKWACVGNSSKIFWGHVKNSSLLFFSLS